MSAHTDLGGAGKVAATTRGIIWFSFSASVLIGSVSLAVGATSIVGELATGRISMILETHEALPAAADGGTASIVDGSFDRAVVVLENLSTVTIVLSTFSSITSVLVGVALAFSLAVIAWRVLHPDPFRRSLSYTVALAGGAVLVGSMLSGGMQVFASFMAATELNGGEPGFWPIMAGFDPGPIALGFALLLVGLAFEIGEKLQRDAAGLV